MNTSYIRILRAIEAFANEHLQVKKFSSDFPSQMPNFGNKDENYPILFVSPSNSIYNNNTNTFDIKVYCFDIIKKDRANINNVLSDTNQILNELVLWLKYGELAGIDLLESSSATAINNSLLDYATGWVVSLTLEVERSSTCEIPFNNIPLILYVGNEIAYYNALTCNSLVDCPIISGMTEDLYYLKSKPDIYVTGGTVTEGTATFVNSSGGTFSIAGFGTGSGGGGGAVSSVFTRTGAVIALPGDYTTAQVTESGNLYYTDARVTANPTVVANTSARHNAVTLGTPNGLSLSTQALSLALASTSATGALSSTDWNTFNNKTSNLGTVTSVAALTINSTGTDATSSVATNTTTPVITLSLPSSSSANRGLLTSIDWSTFNNKQPLLISGTNLRTVNGNTLLGSTNIAVQDVLVSTVNIKTINGTSILGPGDLIITGATGSGGTGTVTSVGITLGTTGTDANANVTSSTTNPMINLNLPSSNASNRGLLTNTDWTTFNGKQANIAVTSTADYYRGDKTFATLNTLAVPELTNLYYTEARVSANTNVAANTAARHNAVTIGTGNGLSLATQALSLALASTSVTGALSSTDWNTFNSKTSNLGTVTSVAALTLGSSGTDANSSVATNTTTPVITLNLPSSSAANRGLLTAADWSTFNSKTSNVGTVTTVNNLTHGTTGTDINSSIVNGTSTPTITLNIPTASAANRGALSSTDWSTFNSKTSNLGTVTSVAALTINSTGTDATSSVANGTTTPVITLSLPSSSASNRGLLTAADWSTFNTASIDRLKWDGGATGLVAATGRASLGATTLGSNLLTSPNVTTSDKFARANFSDNSVSWLDAAAFRSAIGVGAGTGDMLLGTSQTVTALKTFNDTTLGMRNVGNTFTSTFTNTATAARTYTLQDKSYTIADNADLAAKAPLASPALTGVPTAPTATVGTNTTQLATTAFVLANAGGGGLSGGNTGTIPKWTSSTTIGNSNISDDGNFVAISKPIFVGNISPQIDIYSNGPGAGQFSLGTFINGSDVLWSLGSNVSSVNTLNVYDTGQVSIGGLIKTNGVDKFQVNGSMSITGNNRTIGSITANTFVMSGGTSTQYLMANGTTSTGGIPKDTGTTYTTNFIKTVSAAEYAAIGTKDPNTLYFVI